MQQSAVTLTRFFFTDRCVRWLLDSWLRPTPHFAKVNDILATVMRFPSKTSGKLVSQSQLDQATKRQVQELLRAIISTSVSCDSIAQTLFEPSDFMLLMECLDYKQQVDIAMIALKEDLLKTANKELVFRFAKILASSVNALTIAGTYYDFLQRRSLLKNKTFR